MDIMLNSCVLYVQTQYSRCLAKNTVGNSFLKRYPKYQSTLLAVIISKNFGRYRIMSLQRLPVL